MVEINFSVSLQNEANRWKDILDSLSIGHTLTIQEGLDEPILLHGSDKVEGKEGIYEYLDKLTDFVAQWRECRCDRYDFEI